MSGKGRLCLCVWLITGVCWGQSASRSNTLDGADIGLVTTKPATGRSVQTDRGWMVPYAARVPGTKITFDMVPIPGGTFAIGSSPLQAGHQPDESPVRTVVVEPFWMGRCEVTWAEYHVFMECNRIFRERARALRRSDPGPQPGGVDAVTAPTELYDVASVYEFGDEPRDPAVTMTNYAARQYTKWLSLLTGSFYRLPSEAEWEYAARAGTGTVYFFGDDPAQLTDYAWFRDNADDEYHNVGLKKPNPWGLCDIYGNVAELTLDAYEKDAYRQLPPSVSAAAAIEWPIQKYPHTIRGGSFDSSANALRSAARAATSEQFQEDDPDLPTSPWWYSSWPAMSAGFRLMRPLRAPQGAARERYWAPSAPMRADVLTRIREGRGSVGLVDRELIRALVRKRGLREIRERENPNRKPGR